MDGEFWRPVRDPFPPEKWLRRTDRSQEPKWDFSDLTGMFGMAEMEAGVADVMNKARADGCFVCNVLFVPEDLKSDADAFRELRDHGWLVESNGRFRLDIKAVHRIHRRYPHV